MKEMKCRHECGKYEWLSQPYERRILGIWYVYEKKRVCIRCGQVQIGSRRKFGLSSNISAWENCAREE